MEIVSVIQQRIETSFNAQPLMHTLGARLHKIEKGEVVIELPFSEKLAQQHGYLHAGAITSVVDTACGYAALSCGPEDSEVVSAEFKVNLLRPAIGETFFAIGTVENAGKNLCVCRGEVRAVSGGEEKIVALMQATMMYVPKV